MLVQPIKTEESIVSCILSPFDHMVPTAFILVSIIGITYWGCAYQHYLKASFFVYTSLYADS